MACPICCGEVPIDAYIVTCEHGGNGIPAAYRKLFRGKQDMLNSHRGYDPGALTMARALAAALNAPLLASTTSRLLIDLNRPAGHPNLYSTITRQAPPVLRAAIARDYYEPYWESLSGFVRSSAQSGRRVTHISAHSFAPVLNGQVRTADVGLLYDPARGDEAELCARWKSCLMASAPELRVRRNYPYYGKAPGLTAHMRRQYSVDTYVGVELEVNQSIVVAAGRRWNTLRGLLTRSLLAACDQSGTS